MSHLFRYLVRSVSVIRLQSQPQRFFQTLSSCPQQSENSLKANYTIYFGSIRTRSLSSICSPSTFRNMNDNNKDRRIIWVDLEMTGLDVEKDRILEIACIVTEKDLTVVAEGPNLIIHQADDILDGMNEWCVQHHGESGLTEAVRGSKINVTEAERMVLEFVEQHTPKGRCPLGGNSVGCDKEFITRYMPSLAEHLHYRIIDVSTVKELCRRWYPGDFKTAPAKKLCHRAMDDIRESIQELKYYRTAIFK